MKNNNEILNIIPSESQDSIIEAKDHNLIILPFEVRLPVVELTEGKYEKTESLQCSFEYRGEKFIAESKLLLSSNFSSPASINFSILRNREKITYFASTLMKKIPGEYMKMPIWQIYTRRVEKNERRKGFATMSLLAIEELITQYNRKYSEKTLIRITTGLTSLTKLILDQEWLGSIPQLLEYKHGKSINFNYRPENDNVAGLIEILNKESEELDDLEGSNHRSVHLIKETG